MIDAGNYLQLISPIVVKGKLPKLDLVRKHPGKMVKVAVKG